MSSAAHTHTRELDRRSADGIEVRLLWSAETDRVWIAVCDTHAGSSFEFEVDPDRALEAFRHPYAFAA